MSGISYTFLSRHPTTSHFLKIPDTTPRVGFLPLRQWRVNANRDAQVPSTVKRYVFRKRRELRESFGHLRELFIFALFPPSCYAICTVEYPPSPLQLLAFSTVLSSTCIEGLRVSSLGTEKRERKAEIIKLGKINGKGCKLESVNITGGCTGINFRYGIGT